ncbi:MAG: DEAD/DEAH box helicase [Phycisphaerales bacterium]
MNEELKDQDVGGRDESDGAEQDATDGAEASASENGEPGEKKKKRRRRRRRGGSSKEREGSEGAGESTDESTACEGDEASDDDTPKKKPKKDPPPAGDNWDELFDEKTFADLGLRNSVVKGVEEMGYKHPTRIQAMMIPMVIGGSDVLGQARTGSGKTAAFGLPLFHCAERNVPVQSIILAPTRELAIQIASELEEFGKHTPIKVCAVYGGQRISTQADKLERGPEIVVATPGRLMDLKKRRMINFDNVRFAVLDEVDRMLDIGFRDEIRRILREMKSEHQTVFVSATISDEIEKLARQFMHDPEKIVATSGSLTVNMVDQYYMTVEPWDKKRLLHHVLTHEAPDLTVIFCRMKRTVDDLTSYLSRKGVDAHAIHGDMYQSKRNAVMERLRSGELSVLVASDLAARGLDIDNISHVINYDLPEDPEVYIHRIGRTARAGRDGVAWSLVTPEQGGLLTDIEKLANIHIPAKTYDDFKPGPVPDKIAAERERDETRMAELKSENRYQGPKVPPTQEKVDPSKFPGGVVPSKLPPKRMGGRAKTRRGR